MTQRIVLMNNDKRQLSLHILTCLHLLHLQGHVLINLECFRVVSEKLVEIGIALINNFEVYCVSDFEDHLLPDEFTFVRNCQSDLLSFRLGFFCLLLCLFLNIFFESFRPVRIEGFPNFQLLVAN